MTVTGHKERIPGVSVVIATLNGQAHLAEQLRSISTQTHKPLEILIGDDGSTDGTMQVIEDFSADTDIPVSVVVNDERLGYGENFMRTATRARGTIIAFADQDDVWLDGRLQRAVEVLESSDVAMWISGWMPVDESLTPIRLRRLRVGFHQRSAAAYPLFVFHGSRMVFWANLLDYLPAEGRPISVYGKGSAHHDEWAFFAACALGGVHLDAEPLMLYRRHAGAVSAQSPSAPSIRWLLSRVGEASITGVTAAAKERAWYFAQRSLAPDCNDVSAQLGNAARYYEGIVPRLIRRCVTRTSPAARDRAGGLARSLFHGDYRLLAQGGFGVFNLLQDVYAVAHPETPRRD